MRGDVDGRKEGMKEGMKENAGLTQICV